MLQGASTTSNNGFACFARREFYVHSVFLEGEAMLLIGVMIAVATVPQSASVVRQQIIEKSIRGYSGSCPCPYSQDRAGRRCGARSAHSRPGGRAPKCFAEDVTDAEVAAFRRSA